MVSFTELLHTVESALMGGSAVSPQQRAELNHLLHLSLPDFKSFLTYPIPKSTDRTQVLSKEVHFPNSPPTLLDDQDVQIALKLSDDLHLNEISCVDLLVATHQEWGGLQGREPLGILRLAAGLWFTERRALITTLQLLLRAVVLDEELDADLVSDIRQYLEEILKTGLRQRLIELVKGLNREEPAGCGGPGVEPYVIDSRGALVQRANVAQRERLSLCQCLVLSCLILRANVQEVKETYSLLKDCSSGLNLSEDIVKIQIAYTLMFSVLITLVSDALGGAQDLPSTLAQDTIFRKEFQDLILETINDSVVEGFTSVVCLAWSVFIMLTSDFGAASLTFPDSDSVEANGAKSSLDRACQSNVFKFLVNKVIKTPAFQNDDEDLVFIYCAYLHKLLTSFLSQPLGRDKVKELRDTAMLSLDSYYYESTYGSMDDEGKLQQEAMQTQVEPFLSLIDLISKVYQQVPDLTVENEVLWNFVRFVSEDHTSHLTLVAFLNMLTALASNEEGAKRVHKLLQNKLTRSVGWQTLFNSLNIYEQQFQQSIQNTGALLPPLQDGDARALEAYLHLLTKVMENGNKFERLGWFPDIEPLFKLLAYENVPAYLKGALRNTIAAFVSASPVLKDKVWNFLERYDLPLVMGPILPGDTQQRQFQRYDMVYELNEGEARREEYPSTLSYLKLLNVLISHEVDVSDRGRRFSGIFKFVRDQVFGPYSQRAYTDVSEKWKLAVACLEHFQMMLSMFNFSEEDIKNTYMDNSNTIITSTVGPAHDFPAVELMKDLMSGKIVFRNIMGILMLGVNKVLEERLNQVHGTYLEDAVRLSFEVLLLAFKKDSAFADVWRPIYQSLDSILIQDNRQIVALLEYVRYDALVTVQQYAIQILNILCARIPHMVSIIVEAGVAESLIEDYAACLEARINDCQAPENLQEDSGFLILQLLLNNLSRPSPNITHLLLRFDVDLVVERTYLQPSRHYSCLRILLNLLDTLEKPGVNAVLHEFALRLFYELCVDPVTSAAALELLRSEKYKFFSKHLNTFACETLPQRTAHQPLRISSLHQRAWLLKLLALELHVSDVDIIIHREDCRHLLSELFLQETQAWDHSISSSSLSLVPRQVYTSGSALHKMKVLELLDIVQFRPPSTQRDPQHELLGLKNDFMINDIFGKHATVEEGGVYYFSERGDRLVDLAAFRDKLLQEYMRLESQHDYTLNDQRQAKLRDAVQKLLRLEWKHNKNLEEQAGQLHMLMAWGQLVEVAISQRLQLIHRQPRILFEIMDAALSATISPDCSLKMSLSLIQVVMTCLGKLQEQSFTPLGDTSDDVTYVDLLSSARLSNSACQTILSKLIASILRPETSEVLRRRQYAIMLRYFHYCRGMVDPDVSLSVMRSLLLEGQDGVEDLELERLDKEQEELAQINFSIIKHEACPLFDLLTKDATQGSELGKAMAFYALQSLLGIDRDQLFLSQLQSRGLLSASLSDISNNSYQAVLLPSHASVRHLYTLEAELGLLLRVGYQNKKRGAQTLFAMGTLQHLTSCRAVDVHVMEDAIWDKLPKVSSGTPLQHERRHQIVAPVLRLVLCMTTLVDSTDPSEKDGSGIVSEILEFIRVHEGLFSRILRDDGPAAVISDLEELQLATAILCKVWPMELSDDLGFSQALHNLAYNYFLPDVDTRNRFVLQVKEAERMLDLESSTREVVRNMELLVAKVRYNLISYLFSLVAKKGHRFHISKANLLPESLSGGKYTLGRQRQPSLKLVANLLAQASIDLESSLEEMSLLVAKIQDVNELSRHEVDEIIKAYGRLEYGNSADSIRKRRYLAILEMCIAAANRESLVALLQSIIEHALNILYIHLESRLQMPENLKQYVRDDVPDTDEYLGTREEIRHFQENLLPTLQRLEGLSEERKGRDTQQLKRLVRSLKSRIL